MPVYATTTQILDAFASLDDNSLLALRCYALFHIGGTGFSEPLDLMHEALNRALEGRRNWPMNVNFGLFLALAMRSIADGERKRHENCKRSFMSIDDALEQCPEEMTPFPSAEEEFMALEEMHFAEKTASDARMAMVGDREALRVLEGLLAGLTPTEMRRNYGMDHKAFDAARHRVLRRLRARNTH